MESEKEWKERIANGREERKKLTQALRTFFKIFTAVMRPTQLQSFSKLLDFFGVEEKMKAVHLPEVIAGQ